MRLGRETSASSGQRSPSPSSRTPRKHENTKTPNWFRAFAISWQIDLAWPFLLRSGLLEQRDDVRQLRPRRRLERRLERLSGKAAVLEQQPDDVGVLRLAVHGGAHRPGERRRV